MPSRPVQQRMDRSGMAMLVVLMIIAGLLVVGQMTMLLIDNVAQRSGSFRRTERSQYCAEEGLNLGRAWVLAESSKHGGAIPAALLTGNPPGTGLLTDPALPTEFKTKDLCSFPSQVPTTLGGQTFYGLGGTAGQSVCRLDSSLTYCGSPPCPLYRINLVDDMDEPPNGTLDPYTDHNQTIFIRSECMSNDTQTGVALNGTSQIQDTVASMEVNEAGAGNCYGPGGSGAGCGGGYAN